MGIIPNLEAAYKELRPTLIRALGRLARQGFVTFPADSLDLIHDFFLEAWTGLVDRYDPDRGKFETYVCGAFVHFVRPRIVHLQRLQGVLMDPEDIANLSHESLRIESNFAFLYDTKIVKDALSQLPPLEKAVLTSYVYSQRPSERMVAEKFDLSRYRVREILKTSLGRIIVLLDKPERMSERDWRVACAIWRDWRTHYETARYLGLTEYQVREANSRNLQLIAETLRNYQSTPTRRKLMPSQESFTHLESLLLETLKSPGNWHLLQQLRENSDEILDALGRSDLFGLSEEEITEIDPLWIAEVYDALSPVFHEEIIDERWFYATADQEASIGAALREALLPGLPEHLRNIDHWFESVPRVDDEEAMELLKNPDAIAGEPFSNQLVRYGITPLTIFYATEAVSSLLVRLIELDLLEVPIILGLNVPESQSQLRKFVDPNILIDEIRRVAECRAEIAPVLHHWLIQVAQYKPFIFAGFQAEPTEAGVCLSPTTNSYENLFQRWGLLAERAAACNDANP